MVVCVTASTMAMVACQSASAQSAAPVQRPDTGEQLEDVVVTAQRREQNVQSIPVSVTALSAETLGERQITQTLDLARAVPNLVASNNVLLGTSVTYFLRGTGSTESIATFDLPVGTYVDEVYISRQNANQISLSNIDRVEVLRGPQGTLFGRNTTGGAVSIITRKPAAEAGFQGEASYGSYNRLTFNALVDAPISEKVRTQFSGFVVREDGYLRNPPTGERLNGENSWGGRAAVRLLPTDRLTWDLSAQYIHTTALKVGVPGIVKPGPAGPFTVYPEPSTGSLTRSRYDARECKPTGPVDTWAAQRCLYDGVNSTLLISNVGYDVGIGTVNLISGYSLIRQSFNADNFANTDQPILGGGFGSNFYISTRGRHQQFSNELKFAGKIGTIADIVVGLYQLAEDNRTEYADTVGTTLFGYRDPMTTNTRTYAAYGQGDVHLTPELNLQLGGRYTHERKTFGLNAIFFGVPVGDADLLAAGVPLSQTVNRFTPRVALQYRVTPEVQVFASYTEGFKSGGWNARAFSAALLQPFRPEFVTSYEAGVKSELFDRRLRANVTAFRADYSELQVPSIIPGATDFITLNAASARVQGLESEFLGRVGRGTTLFLNLGLMDGKYTKLAPIAIAGALGPKMQRVPDVTTQVGVSQEFAAGEHRFTVNADVQYTSSYETGPANTLAGHVDGQATVNAQLAWRLPGDRWQIALECKNCTNNVYVVQELLGSLFSNDPRRITLRAGVKF